VRFSVWPNTDVKFDELATTVEVSERLGFFAAYLPDHLMPDGHVEVARGDVLESTVSLAALAARTASIRLGILVAAATFRHPAVYAKSLCSIDQISGGRAIAGIGAGWEENEHRSFGISLGSTTERVNRFEEYVSVVASMLANEVTSFSGNYFVLRDAPCNPRPVQSPLPMLLGVRGRHRTMGIAARHATLWNAWSTPDDLVELNKTLDDWCERVGRPPADLQRTVNTGLFLSDDESWLRPFRGLAPGGPALVGKPEEIAEIVNRYRRTQCDELILTFDTDATTRHLDMLAMFMEQVVPLIAQ
jgi:alkanesulfonate monooxygenase SsuD/methylene tetrahydromethanopterin reductase-like flavin-dependent oxidoreductase (luciferase family)